MSQFVDASHYYSTEQIRQKYDRFARWYDWVVGIADLLYFRRLRARMLRQASGNVLEIGIGTGLNLPHYPRLSHLTGVDLSAGMVEKARRRAARLGRYVSLLLMDAEHLAFVDGAFDAVVDCLNLCTYRDPAAALREMARVCRAGGRILLIEHGVGNRTWLREWQDRTAAWHAKSLGCHWNRELLDLIERVGLVLVNLRRTFWGVFYEIEVRPR